MLVGQSGGPMVNLPWPLALRSQLFPHKLTTVRQCFIQALFGGGEAESPRPREKLPKSRKYPHDFKIMFTK